MRDYEHSCQNEFKMPGDYIHRVPYKAYEQEELHCAPKELTTSPAPVYGVGLTNSV